MSSGTTLVEDTEDTEEIDAAAVQARVHDWQDRINALYRQLRVWSPPELTWDTSQHLTMHEEMMKKFGIESVELPVLNITDASGWKAKIIPYGLWIIGGDGRLDLLTGSKRYLITGVPRSVDTGWQISEPGSRQNTNTLDQSSWLVALR